jgi:predicted dehydrogenase
VSTTAEPATSASRSATRRRKIGVGVIGFGWLGQAHTRSLLRIPTLFERRGFDTELVACSDTLPARVDQAVSSFGFKRGSAAWESVIEDWPGPPGPRAPRA